MDDLLKEAIADAKAVRETALANAKMALEEAFTPRLKSMLAQKIQHEVEDEEKDKDEIAYEVEDEEEGMAHDEEEGEHEDADEISYNEEEDDEEDHDEISYKEEEEDEEDHDEMKDESNVIEIDGVKYAPVVSEEEDEEEVEEVEDKEEGEDEMDEADELDLESILRELEEEEEEDEDKDEVKENDVSSGIGKSDNAHNKEAGDSSKVGQGPEGEGSDKEAGKELGDHEVVKEGEDKEEGEDEMDEDIDLEEVLKALSEEEEVEEEVDETATLKQEIKEHRDVVKYLRAKLNEVNLLNAKLLFSNKLFRTFGLTNEQKMKVVETFDRTKNLREIKLVYSTLSESFGQSKPAPIKESVRKGSSSKAVASTKPKKEVISEGDDLKARFKKLANII